MNKNLLNVFILAVLFFDPAVVLKETVGLTCEKTKHGMLERLQLWFTQRNYTYLVS